MFQKIAARAAAHRPRSFMPRGQLSVVLLEHLEPRNGAEANVLARVTPCTRAYAAAELGSGAALREMVQAGTLRELPGHCTPAQFRELFADISIVSRTGVDVESHGNGRVHLAAPTGTPVSISTALYEVLRRSTTGTVSIPAVIDRVAPKWGDPDALIVEIIDSLRSLLASGAVVLVQTLDAEPFVPPRVEVLTVVDDDVRVPAMA